MNTGGATVDRDEIVSMYAGLECNMTEDMAQNRELCITRRQRPAHYYMEEEYRYCARWANPIMNGARFECCAAGI